jgi:diguanylate cyclase
MPALPFLFLVAAFAVSAALLWLATGLAAVSESQPRRLAHGLVGVSVWLGTCGVAWPAIALRLPGLEGSPGPAWFWGLLPAALLAALAVGFGMLWRRGLRPRAVIVAVAMPGAAYVHAMLSAPGVFRLADLPGWVGAGTLMLILSLALLAPLWRPSEAPFARAVRAAGALTAAAICTLGAAASVTATDAAQWVVGPDWLAMLSLPALGAVLLAVGRRGHTPEVSFRPARAAAVDHLTGLPTRLFFERRLDAAAKRCDARAGRLAVLFIDLDGFKPVNDTFGHSSGDRVLEQVGQRLKAMSRGSVVAARVGGDEFLLLATGTGDADRVARIAQRLVDTLSEPYRLDDREVTISCSVGIATYPDGCQSQKLIARADAAMYAAKRAGGSRHCFYAPEMDAGVQQNFDLLRELREALAKDELELFFQPKIDARSGKVTAAEALLRWNHPTRGTVMPGDFVPLAERAGLIGPLGNWVIEAACKQARAWRDKGLRMRVAINLSAHQMRQDDIADRIAEALKRHRIHPSLLTCEITETAAMEDTGATQETFRRLGELGTHLSIDDFGTGYSSLSYLRRLPAEELKIDASFVGDLEHSADARAVIDAVVKLAHALGLKVVAEGVETPRQHKILTELGCDELQGFLFAKPMTARALLLWAMGDRSTSAVFRNSLFGETRQTTFQATAAQAAKN